MANLYTRTYGMILRLQSVEKSTITVRYQSQFYFKRVKKEVGILKRFDLERILLISRDDLRAARNTRRVLRPHLIREGKNWRIPLLAVIVTHCTVISTWRKYVSGGVLEKES